jgi:hypothetical protein
MIFKFQKQRNNVWEVNFLWVLTCLLTSLSTLFDFLLFSLFSSSVWKFILPIRLGKGLGSEGIPGIKFSCKAREGLSLNLGNVTLRILYPCDTHCWVGLVGCAFSRKLTVEQWENTDEWNTNLHNVLAMHSLLNLRIAHKITKVIVNLQVVINLWFTFEF